MIGFYTISKRNVEIYKLIYKDSYLVIKSSYKSMTPTLKNTAGEHSVDFHVFQHFADI